VRVSSLHRGTHLASDIPDSAIVFLNESLWLSMV
jgi:hypothetical protein